MSKKRRRLEIKVEPLPAPFQDEPVVAMVSGAGPTVLAFSTNSSVWRPNSRQIATTRPDQTGMYKIRNLPAGEYYVVAVDPSEPGEWFEPAYLDQHRAGAARVTLGDGDVKTHDFRVQR